MSRFTDIVNGHRNLLLRISAAWTTAGVLIYVCVPYSAPGLILLSPILPLCWCLLTTGLPPSRLSGITIVLIIAAGYLTWNASWSLSPASAHRALYMVFIAVVALHFVFGALRACDSDVSRAMAAGLYVGTVIAGAVMLVETHSELWIHRKLMSVLPTLRPSPHYIKVEDGWVTFLEPHYLNRNFTALTFVFWPTVLSGTLLARTIRMRGWLLAGLVPAAAAILTSTHATSRIAFLGAATAWLAFHRSPIWTKRAISWSWAATIVLVVPVSLLAYQGQLYLSPWLPNSAQHRIVIWGYTSQQIAKAPILGAGIDTSRTLDETQSRDAPLAPGSSFKLTTGWHSHNDYMQVWFETGAVGAIILISIGLLVLRSLAQAPVSAQPYLYATFVTCALLAATSFSLWQPWFMASFAFAASFAMVGRVLTQSTTS